MNDQEFVLEVTRDFFDEIRYYIRDEISKKGKITNRHSVNHTSKKGNKWLIIYRSDYGGEISLHVKRPQPKKWFSWYSLIWYHNGLTLFGFNKHVAERISERYNPELTPSEALKEMFIKTPAIVQSDTGKEFYTCVNGGICIGSVYGKRYSINIGSGDLQVDLRDTNTFISDDLLYDDQKKITNESIKSAIERLGRNYLTDSDR